MSRRLSYELFLRHSQLHGRYDELSELSYGPGIKLGAYHCQLLGVSPKHQHRGVGGALMAYAEEKVSNGDFAYIS